MDLASYLKIIAIKTEQRIKPSRKWYDHSLKKMV